MSKFKTAISLLREPYKLIVPLDSNRMIDWMPDKMFAELSFRGAMGYRLNLNNPITFNEKLQWLKIYDRRDYYTSLVDKLAAKKVVGDIIGHQYIVKSYGDWRNANEIPFAELPSQFVIKCNHDQGSVVVVNNKEMLNVNEVINFLNKKLKKNIYYGTREYAYKNIKPRVFAEEFLGANIIDYKFYCFNGTPKFLYCGKGLTSDHSLRIDFFDLEWNPMPFYRTDYLRLGSVPKPSQLGKMISIAKQLSKGVPFVRIDLFEVNNHVYFSEFTLCPASGFMPFVPKEYDRIVGEWIKLPNKAL